MEGFCRGCLVKYDEPTDLIPYSEKNRRLFIYSTGLQVKRNDTFTFQLCKECYLNMKQSCTFKKQCRNSEKKFKNYMSLKGDGDAIDFCSYIKNCEDLLTIRLPLASGNNTPAYQKTKEDDNDSTCTSIRNFMSDILQGEEVPDTEARIIKELIEEEADVLDDSLDSHWLQDDMSIATDFRMDFSFSPFSTPRSIQNDHCYTPKRLNDDKDDYFTLKQIEKPPDDEQYDMPILDDCDIDIDQPANIPMDNIKTDCYTQKERKDEINSEVNETECGSYTGVESQIYDVDNLKLNEIKNQNYEINNLKLNETLKQNYEVNNTVDVNVNSKSVQEIYFVEQITDIEPNEIIEDDFIHIGEKTQDFITATEIENDFYNITNNSNQSKVGKDIEETSLLNNELEYYINKAEFKKKSTEEDKKCLIDRNLEKALENEDNQEIPLDMLLSSPKVDIRSGASTPTIRNILFGDTLSTSNDSLKLGQCIEKYHPIEGQTNLLDDFLKDEDSNNIGNVKIKGEIVPDFNNIDLVKNKVEILNIKVINEQDIENCEIENKFENEMKDKFDSESENKLIESNLISKEEKSEDIRDLIEDYVMNVYENVDGTVKNINNEEIDALELLKATNTTLDDSLFKKPLTPLYDKYDLEKSECKICNKNFKTEINLRIHFTKKHKFKIVTKIPKPKQTRFKEEVCDVCGETAKGKANLNIHKIKAHGGKEFSCTECLLQFPTLHGLEIHKRSHNLVKNKSKVYRQICEICGKKQTTGNYKVHLLRHLKEFQFNCEICGKGLYKKGDYEIHLRTHTNSRPFKCKICPKTYKRRASLKCHTKLHLENKEFICDICSTRFTSKLFMKKHFGTKHCDPAKKNQRNSNKTSEKQYNPDKTSVEQYDPDKTSENDYNPDIEMNPKVNPEKTSKKEFTPDIEMKPIVNLDNEISGGKHDPDKTPEDQYNPDKTTEEHHNPDKTLDEEYNPDTDLQPIANPDNKKSEERYDPDKTSDEQCDPDKISEKEYIPDRYMQPIVDPENKILEEQCNTNKTSEEQYDPDKTSEKEYNPDIDMKPIVDAGNKILEEQCNTGKTLEEQYDPDKTSEKESNPDNKTSEIITADVFETSELPQDVSMEETEETITERIEFTVKFSPISVREDEPSDPLLDFY